jgi:hypothetical protein
MLMCDGRRGVREEDGRAAGAAVVDKLTGPLERVCINTGLVKKELKPTKERKKKNTSNDQY